MCASCEICSYHLGLESPDLSPPFKDMYICDVCNRTYHWQCLLKTSCCSATEREAIGANDSWACPACISLNQNEKESRNHFPAIQEGNTYQPYNVNLRNKVALTSNPPTHRLTSRPQGIVSTGSQSLIS